MDFLPKIGISYQTQIFFKDMIYVYISNSITCRFTTYIYIHITKKNIYIYVCNDTYYDIMIYRYFLICFLRWASRLAPVSWRYVWCFPADGSTAQHSEEVLKYQGCSPCGPGFSRDFLPKNRGISYQKWTIIGIFHGFPTKNEKNNPDVTLIARIATHFFASFPVLKQPESRYQKKQRLGGRIDLWNISKTNRMNIHSIKNQMGPCKRTPK